MNYQDMSNDELIALFQEQSEYLAVCPNSKTYDRTQMELNEIRTEILGRMTDR
jgi:hypothetical protein